MSEFDLDDDGSAEKLHKARKRVEAALNLARDTRASQAERDAAIAGARRIVSANKLDPASFDWPGEPKREPKPRDDLFGDRSSFESVFRSFEEALRRQQAAARGARWDARWEPSPDPRARHYAGRFREAPDGADAFRQAAEGWRREEARRARAEADARRKEAERERRRTWDAGEAFEGDPNRSGPAMDRHRADLAVRFLWAADVRVYPTTDAPDGSRLFVIPEEGDLEYTDAGVIEVANRHGWAGGATFGPDGQPQPEEQPAPDSFRAYRIHGVPDEVIGRAIVYLAARGIVVKSIPDSDYWECDGEVVQTVTVVLAAKLRGFKP